MINKYLDISDIKFDIVDVDEKLISSIRQRGIAIPVKVSYIDNTYVCTDGNKRLSACLKLIEEDDKYRKVLVVIDNDYSKAGSGYWGNTKNKH